MELEDLEQVNHFLTWNGLELFENYDGEIINQWQFHHKDFNYIFIIIEEDGQLEYFELDIIPNDIGEEEFARKYATGDDDCIKFSGNTKIINIIAGIKIL